MLALFRRIVQARSIYLIMMGAGALLGLIRGFLVAGIVPAVEFGLYATAIAVGLFFAPLLGLGQIETMRKRFPRLWVEERAGEIAPMTDRLLRVLGRRAALVAGLTLAVFWLAGGDRWLVLVAAASLIPFNQTGAAVMASALRAGPDLRPLAFASLFRASAALVLAVAGAFSFGLEGAVAGEALGGLMGLFLARWLLGRLAGRRRSEEKAQALPAGSETENLTGLSPDGLRLFLATLAISVPLYLSRPVVGAVFGNQALGTFAFLMLFAQGALTFYSIIDQIVGPGLVRMAHGDTPLRNQRRYLLTVLVLVGLTIVAGLVTAFVILDLPQLVFYAGKYDLALSLVSPLCLFATMQLASTLDWMLQAHDREQAVLRAAGGYLLTFTIGTLVIWLAQMPLSAFLWMMVAAKGLQLILQVATVWRIREPSPVC